jgi:16S rRNA (guanine966-N2)-methyltransferase
MHLRVIGGTFRNRSLIAPKGPQTRPTLAILRKAVFDICQTEITDASFLDLFAGSGAMGIEAISRGAQLAVFIDQDRYAIQSIEENLKTLQIETQGRIIRSDAIPALKKLISQGARFDIVYIDPPYAKSSRESILSEILTLLDTSHLLNPGALVFTEEAAPAHLDPGALSFQHLIYLNTRQFSQSVLHQFYCN